MDHELFEAIDDAVIETGVRFRGQEGNALLFSVERRAELTDRELQETVNSAVQLLLNSDVEAVASAAKSAKEFRFY